MLNKLQDSLKKIEKSKEFEEYKKENKDSYLTSALMIIEEGSENTWNIDFYSPKKHKITTFKLVGEKCDRSQENEILQKEKVVLKELKIEDIKINLAKAFEKASEFLKDEININPKKIIVVLQEHEKIPIWNLTYLTNAFNLLNVKLNAKDGSVIKHEKVPLFKMG